MPRPSALAYPYPEMGAPALLFVILTLASACATPIGVVKGDTQTVYHALTRSVLSTEEPSAFTEQILQRHGLAERFEDNPAAVLSRAGDPRRMRDRRRWRRNNALCHPCEGAAGR